MRKKLFLAIAMIAYSANGFASNEVVNTLEDSNINPPKSSISSEKATESLEGGYRICSTVEYKRPMGVYLTEYTGMDGQVYTTTTWYYVTTGACTTCTSMGHNGTSSSTTCWGYGF